ncbi:MAG: hypothetical protein H7Z14_10085, partial [Anaerolineae bacterium]|nr:hypothetical protein [Phycisphaerae bacterium]
MRYPILCAATAAVLAIPAVAQAQLLYSFETLYNNAGVPDPAGTRPDRFHANGGGVTVAQDTIGVTEGTRSMRVAIVAGATFVGAQTELVTAEAPLINSASNGAIAFDLTVPATGLFAGAFARIGITEFGNNPTQELAGVSVQTVANAERNFALEPGTYRFTIPLIGRENPVTFDTGPDFRGVPYSSIFGPNTDNQLQETASFQFYLNKSNDSASLIYIDNVRAVFQGPSYQFSADADVNWLDDSRWQADVPVANFNTAPNTIDANAILGAGLTAPRTVTVNAPVTVGSITFENGNSYNVAGTATLTLDVSSGQSGLTVNRGFHTIAAPLALNDDTTVGTPPATATLQVTNLQSTTKVVTKIGLGTFSVNNIRAGGLAVNQGTVSVGAAGTNAATSRLGTLSFAGGATPTASLDLNDNDLIVTSGTYAAITNAISKARNGGAWNQPGLTSSPAAAAVPKNKTLGTLTGAEFHTAQGAGATFDGFTVANSDVLVKFTYYGDVDFNGLVDFDDYSRI